METQQSLIHRTQVSSPIIQGMQEAKFIKKSQEHSLSQRTLGPHPDSLPSPERRTLPRGCMYVLQPFRLSMHEREELRSPVVQLEDI